MHIYQYPSLDRIVPHDLNGIPKVDSEPRADGTRSNQRSRALPTDRPNSSHQTTACHLSARGVSAWRLRTDFSDVPLAIIGMGCRLPGADNLERYWELISQGRSAIGEVPAERLDQELYFHPDKGVRGKTYSKVAALLGKRAEIDPERYPISDGPAAFGRPDASDDDCRGGRRAASGRARSVQPSTQEFGRFYRPRGWQQPTARHDLRLAFGRSPGHARRASRGCKVLPPQSGKTVIGECRARNSRRAGRNHGRRPRHALQHGGRHGLQGLWPDRPVYGIELGLRLVAARHVDGGPGASGRPGRHGHCRRRITLHRPHAGSVLRRPGHERLCLAAVRCQCRRADHVRRLRGRGHENAGKGPGRRRSDSGRGPWFGRGHRRTRQKPVGAAKRRTNQGHAASLSLGRRHGRPAISGMPRHSHPTG